VVALFMSEILNNNLLLVQIIHSSGWGYVLALGASFLETILALGLFLPGSSVIMVLGALSAYHWLNFYGVLIFAIMGAVLGDNLNYYLGKKYASSYLKKGFWFLKPAYFKKAQIYFQKHGGKSVFWGRFIPTLKEVIPFIAGAFQMSQKEFIFWNILGGIGWSLEWAGAGYLFAQSLNLARIWLSRAGFFFFFLFLSLSFLFYLRWLVAKRKQQEKYWHYPLWRFALKMILKNKWLQKKEKQSPQTFLFFRSRFDEKKITGLFLTWTLTMLIILGGIIIWGKKIISLQQIPWLDKITINLIHFIQVSTIAQYIMIITYLGKWWFVLILAAFISLFWLRKKEKIFLIPFWIILLGGELSAHWIKKLIGRHRPEAIFSFEKTYSFPSGHATLAMIFYGFLTYYFIKKSKIWEKQLNYFWIGISLIILIGFTRLYLGVHYLSDVIAGYLVGLVWLIWGIILVNWQIKSKK